MISRKVSREGVTQKFSRKDAKEQRRKEEKLILNFFAPLLFSLRLYVNPWNSILVCVPFVLMVKGNKGKKVDVAEAMH